MSTTMHTALVTVWGETPKCIEVEAPPVPAPDSDLVQVKLIAAGLHQLVKSRAAGTHYSSKTLPHTVGIDGVGSTPTGEIVYFTTIGNGGSYSEILTIPKRELVPLPKGMDPIQAAALMNPALSSWMAIKARTKDLPANFTVLIVGVTTVSGTVAISLAKKLGAGKVIGVARNAETMGKLGLDQEIVLKNPVAETDFESLGDVDLILDYLYGEPFEVLISKLKSRVPVQYVQVGSMAGQEVKLNAAALRSKDVTLRGSGPGAWSVKSAKMEFAGMVDGIRGLETKVKCVKLSEIGEVWGKNFGGERLVFIP